MNDNEDTVCQHLCETANIVLRRKFIAFDAFIVYQERMQIKELSIHLSNREVI